MAHRNLASERVRIGLTQKQMADKLGVSVSTLARYEEHGEIPPKVLTEASTLFGCTTDYLLDLTEERV